MAIQTVPSRLFILRVPEEAIKALGFEFIAELRPHSNVEAIGDEVQSHPIWRTTGSFEELKGQMNFRDSEFWKRIEPIVVRGCGFYVEEDAVPDFIFAKYDAFV